MIVIFALLAWKAASTPRDSKTPILMLLIRDGIIYFGVVFVAFLFNLLVWAIGPVRSGFRRKDISLTFIIGDVGPLAT